MLDVDDSNVKYFNSGDVARIMGFIIDNDAIRKCGQLSCGREYINGRWLHYVTKERFIDWLNEQRAITEVPPNERTRWQDYCLYKKVRHWTGEQFDQAMERLLKSEPRFDFGEPPF